MIGCPVIFYSSQMNDKAVITYLLNVFRSFIQGENLSSLDPEVLDAIENPELKELFKLVEASLFEYISGVKSIKLIADGELNFEIKTQSPVLSSLKKLQSKLKHLIWQTQMIAAGDYSQEIDFIGDFSYSFNQLIHSLQQQQELKHRLEEGQKIFKLIADNSNDVIWTIDVNTHKPTYVSPSIFNMRGFTVEEAMAESVEKSASFESVSDVQQYLDLLQTKIRNKETVNKFYAEIQQLHKDGRVIDVEISTNVILDNNGNPKEIVGISRDITERKKAERKLKEREEIFRLITENSRDVIWFMDVATQKFTYMSPSVYQLRGFTVEEAMNQTIEQSTLPDSVVKMKKNLKMLFEAITQKLPIPESNEEYQQWCKNGEVIDIEVSTNLICDQNGLPKEILGISRDITDRKKAEIALRESEEKYRLITEHAKDIIWKMDINTLRYTYISPSITRLTGHTPEEILALPITEILTKESAENAWRIVTERLKLPADPESKICERFQLYTKDKNIVTVEAIASFIRDCNGKPIEIIGVNRDIGERILIENALKESEAKLTQLLAYQSFKNRQLSRQLQYVYNNSSNAIAFFDIDGDIIKFSTCNAKWAKRIGFEPNELEGYDISKLQDTDTSAIYRRVILKTIEEKKPVEEYLNWHDFYLHAIAIPIVNELKGEIKSCGIFVYDMTEKVKSDQQIRETEERFFSIFNHSKDAILLLTMKLEIVDVNESFYHLHGSTDYPKNKVLHSYFPPEYHNKILGLVRNLESGLSIPTVECEVYRHNGTLVPIEISTSVVTIKQTSMLLCTLRDISEKREMERMITNVGTQIETRERRKLASDLHDNVGPLLSSMNMYLSVLSRKEELQPYYDVLSDIKRILKDTMSSVREISNNLSSQVLLNFGLTAALNQFFETKEKLIAIEVENYIGAIRFAEIKEVMIYNIIIEAFNNTLKHSEGNLIKIELRKENDVVRVRYADNGNGFNLEEKLRNNSNHLGLFSIINRVKILGGNYTIETSPGNGFLLMITFPITN